MTTRREYASPSTWMLLTALLCANATQAQFWLPWKGKQRIWESASCDTLQLTENCGAHSFAWHPYQDGQPWRLWNTVVASRNDWSQDRIRAKEFSDLWSWQGEYIVYDDQSEYPNEPGPCITISAVPRKHCAWLQQNASTGLDEVLTARQDLTDASSYWDYAQKVSVNGSNQNEPSLAIAAQSANNKHYLNIVYDDYDEHSKTALLCAHSEDDGQTFVKDVVVRDYKRFDEVYYHASLVPAAPNSATLYCAFHKEQHTQVGDEWRISDTMFFRKSTDGGATWDPDYDAIIASADWDEEWWVEYPCVAAWGDLVLVTYSYNETGLASGWHLRCRTSMDGGTTWDDEERITYPGTYGSLEANCDIVPYGNGRALVAFRFTSWAEHKIYPALYTGSHEYRNGDWQWKWYTHGMALGEEGDYNYAYLVPQVAGYYSVTGYFNRLAGCVWTSPSQSGSAPDAVDVYLNMFVSREGLIPDQQKNRKLCI